MTNPPQTVRPAARASRRRFWTLIGLALAILGPAAYGFVSKFLEFARTFQDDPGGRFTILPMLNYLLVTCGFLCLLAWAVVHGMFRDVERPKYTMLEREAQLDREHPTEEDR